jgi:hypothetical protein
MQLSYVEAEFLMQLMTEYCMFQEKGWTPNYDGESLTYDQLNDLWLRIQEAKFNR